MRFNNYSMPATLNTDRNVEKTSAFFNSSPSSSSLAPGLGTNTGSVGWQFSALHSTCSFVSKSNLIICTKISPYYTYDTTRSWCDSFMMNGIASSHLSGWQSLRLRHIYISVLLSVVAVIDSWDFGAWFPNKFTKHYSTELCESLDCNNNIKLPSLITSGWQSSFPSFSFTAVAVVYFNLTRFSPVSAHYG